MKHQYKHRRSVSQNNANLSIASTNKLRAILTKNPAKELHRLKEITMSEILTQEGEKFEILQNCNLKPSHSYFDLNPRYKRIKGNIGSFLIKPKKKKPAHVVQATKEETIENQISQKIMNILDSGETMRNFLGDNKVSFFNKMIDDFKQSFTNDPAIDEYQLFKRNMRRNWTNLLDLFLQMKDKNQIANLFKTDFIMHQCSYEKFHTNILNKLNLDRPMELTLEVYLGMAEMYELMFEKLFKEISSKKNSVYVKLSQEEKPFIDIYRSLFFDLYRLYKLDGEDDEIPVSDSEKDKIKINYNKNKNFLRAALDLSFGKNYLGVTDMIEKHFLLYKKRHIDNELTIKLLKEKTESQAKQLDKMRGLFDENHTQMIMHMNQELILRVLHIFNPRETHTSQISTSRRMRGIS